METSSKRRDFIKTVAAAGVGLSISSPATLWHDHNKNKNMKVGIIGLDTSHSVAFTELLNDPQAEADIAGFKVVAAYPHGSRDIESSTRRIPEYTEKIKKMGVSITDSIEALLEQVDVVLLETNDGRPHLEQAMQVFRAGKPVFIDKPVAASLSDVLALFEASEQYKVPLFSSSSLRYMQSAQDIRQGKIGQVLGADTYSPAHLEKTHPDLFWYGIHGVETLFTVMGTGCKSVVRTHTDKTDMVVGTWNEQRIGTFRGGRYDKMGYGGTAFGTEGVAPVGPYEGYRPLVTEIVKFFRSGKAPVSPEETIEIYAFMEAADQSKREGGRSVSLESVIRKAREGRK